MRMQMRRGNMLGFLTRTQAPVVESRSAVATKVDTRHIPYVEALWNRLQAARQQVAAKEDYLREAGRLGVKVAAVANVALAAADDAEATAQAAGALERVKRVLALGAEPTTPPEAWYCGMLAQPEPIRRDRSGEPVYPDETWPRRYRSSYRDTVSVFQGAMPLAALQRYAAAKDMIDDVRVYSPREDDFRQMPAPELRDPVLIGRIDFLGEPHYFELARWDIDKDLAVVFGRVTAR